MSDTEFWIAVLFPFVGAALFIAVIAGPILYLKRVLVHVRVFQKKDEPAPGVTIRGVYNRAGPAFSPTGEGALVSRALHAEGTTLGVTDAQGYFKTTLYLRNVHTLRIGERDFFMDHLRDKMSETEAAPLDLSFNPWDPAGHMARSQADEAKRQAENKGKREGRKARAG